MPLSEKIGFSGGSDPVFSYFRQLARGDFARFDVRLIERIDADDRARHRRGNLPAEKFLAEIVDIGQRMRTTGWPAFSSASSFASCSASGAIADAHRQIFDRCHRLRAGQLFAVDRNDAVALFAGGFGDQLFQPCAEIGNSGRSNDGDLVAPVFRSVPRIAPRSRRDFCPPEPDAQACTISRPDPETFGRSIPMTAAGTMPKSESAE